MMYVGSRMTPNPYETPSCQEAKWGCAEDEVFR